MSMNYIFVESLGGLKASQEEYEALKAAVDVANNEDNWSVQCGDWQIEYSDGEVYIGAVFQNSWRDFEGELLALLGTLIAKNGFEYLELRIAIEWPPEYGVTAFRVTRDGSLWHPTLTGWLYERSQVNSNENRPKNN